MRLDAFDAEAVLPTRAALIWNSAIWKAMATAHARGLCGDEAVSLFEGLDYRLWLRFLEIVDMGGAT